MSLTPLTTALPIPSDLKSPHPQTPWRMSPGLFNRISQQPSNDTYKKHELSSSDPEFSFVYTYFNHQKPTNRSIAKVYCIHNPSESAVFENKLPSLEAEAKNPFFQSQWHTEQQPTLRQHVIDRFKSIASSFSPFEVPFTSQRKEKFALTKVLPLWHGSTAAKCDSICRSGFTYFGKHGFTGGGSSSDNTDVGFFGSGIYFTTSARYAADTYSDGENLLLGWVSMREPFPVISDTPNPSHCTDMKRLKGQGAYHKYNAHYIPVVPDPQNPQSANYYPSPLGQQPVWDEIVVFQQSQTLTRFWVVLQIDLTKPVPGSSLTVGDLLQILAHCLDQQAVQNHPQLSQFLENKETELFSFNPSQTLSSSDVVVLNCMNQLLDEQKKLRERIVKKLLTPTTPSITPPTALPSSSSMSNSSSTATHSFQNPLPVFPNIASPKAQPVAPIQAATTPALPAWVCGAAEWKKYIGDPGVEPPLPPEILQRLSELKANHVLVLIPETINGRPLDLKSMGEHVQKPLQGHATKYRNFNLGEHVDRPASKSHWALLTRTVIEGSRNKSYEEGQPVLASYSLKTGIPYEAPTVLDAVVCNFMEYVRFGTWLYVDNPLTFTWCQEKYNGRFHLVVGGSSAPGLQVLPSLGAFESNGVGGLRKF